MSDIDDDKHYRELMDEVSLMLERNRKAGLEIVKRLSELGLFKKRGEAFVDLLSESRIDEGVSLGPNTVVIDSTIKGNSTISENSLISGSSLDVVSTRARVTIKDADIQKGIIFESWSIFGGNYEDLQTFHSLKSDDLQDEAVRVKDKTVFTLPPTIQEALKTHADGYENYDQLMKDVGLMLERNREAGLDVVKQLAESGFFVRRGKAFVDRDSKINRRITLGPETVVINSTIHSPSTMSDGFDDEELESAYTTDNELQWDPHTGIGFLYNDIEEGCIIIGSKLMNVNAEYHVIIKNAEIKFGAIGIGCRIFGGEYDDELHDLKIHDNFPSNEHILFRKGVIFGIPPIIQRTLEGSNSSTKIGSETIAADFTMNTGVEPQQP